MSDFISDFWSFYVALITLVSIIACGVLLYLNSRGRAKPVGSSANAAGDVEDVGTTGHVWDGDLAEYNNPLPRWWMWLFYVTIVFSLRVPRAVPRSRQARPGCWAGPPSANTQRGPRPGRRAHQAAVCEIHGDGPQGSRRRPARRTRWASGCSSTIARSATVPMRGGGKGFPNLSDRDWLYGGEPEHDQGDHHQRPQRHHARVRSHPRRGEASAKWSHYVRSLSGLPHDSLQAQVRQGACSLRTASPATVPKAKGNAGGRRTQPHGRRSGCTAARPTIIGETDRARDGARRRRGHARMPSHKDTARREPASTCSRRTCGASPARRPRPPRASVAANLSPVRARSPTGHEPSSARSCPCRREDGALLRDPRKIYPRAVHGMLRAVARRLILLTQAIFYGMPWLTWNGRQAVLFDLAAPQVLYLRAGLLAAGRHLSRRPADPLARSRCSCSRRSPVACGAATPARRRSTPRSSCGSSARSKAIGSRACGSTRPAVAREIRHQGASSTPRGSRSRCGPAITFVGYFTPIRDLGIRAITWQLGALGIVLDAVLRLRHLRQRRLHARAGVQVHVPVRPFPERDVRPRHAGHHLRRGTRRSARRTRAQASSRAARASAIASIAASACRSVPPASTSARGCSTSASAARRASTAATRSWTRWAIRAGSSAIPPRTRSPAATTSAASGNACCAPAR